MKVLMFGWEFPPHISGGLGTACHGLTRGMAELGQTEVIFVVPKTFGDEQNESLELIGANQIAIPETKQLVRTEIEKMTVIEVDSPLIPYTSETDFWQLRSNRYINEPRFVQTDDGLRVNFKGGYSGNLMSEVKKYALVAGVIASGNSFDIIHAHDWLTFQAGIAAKNVSGKPLVIHVHATEYDRSGGNINPHVYAVEREGMEAADHIIAVSELTKRIIVEKYEIQPEKVSVVYNAVEPLHENDKEKCVKAISEKVVTFLGRITLQKGPEYFIEAAALILKKVENVRFVMAGSGDLINRMITHVAELGIAHRFHFTGFLNPDDVHQLFRMTDVFVMPSVSEPFGIVPLEAMQFNVPVIISHQSGVSEVIKHAVKIDFWDTLAMADAIYGLINYDALSHHFKAGGKIEVENLGWSQSAANVLQVYQSVLNQ